MSEKISILTVVLFMFLKPTITANRENKYAPKVSLLTPKGFCVTIEGSNQNKAVNLASDVEQIGERSKREVSPEINITDVSQGKYGISGTTFTNERHSQKHKTFVLIKNINEDFKDKPALVRGRLQTSRTRGKISFIVLRQQGHTIQCFVRAGQSVSRQMVKFVSNISRESIIDVVGKVQLTSTEIRSCTEKWVEIVVEELWVVSEAETLPIQVIDCARPERGLNTEGVGRILNPESLNIYVSQDKKLDYRVLDLRTSVNQAIFRIESAVSKIFRDALIRREFMEIHTPKILSAASEGGANVFTVSYFKTLAYLAQSPQMYKQMAIAADFERVFTIGAVFRAEESHTSRHLTEFVGLDLEMAFKYHYSEVLDVIEQTFIEIFKTLQNNYSEEISTIRQQFYSEPFVFVNPPPRIKFSECVAMLREAGSNLEENSDLTAKDEKQLGQLIKEKYKTDFFVLDKYPISSRPFYVMADPDNPRLSNSYDIFMRGEEVMSGSQRIHDAELLKSSAMRHAIDLNKIKSYIEAFRYGCPPHAGGGIGLERTVSLYIGLDNVRKTSMFPRDPKRLTP